MTAINQAVEKLHQQFQIRVSGENGVAKGLIDMSNPMESWLVTSLKLPTMHDWKRIRLGSELRSTFSIGTPCCHYMPIFSL